MKIIAEYVSGDPANDLLRIYIAGPHNNRNELFCTIWADDFTELLDDKQLKKWEDDSTYFYIVPKQGLMEKAYWLSGRML